MLGLLVDWCSYKLIVDAIINDLSFFIDIKSASSKVLISSRFGSA